MAFQWLIRSVYIFSVLAPNLGAQDWTAQARAAIEHNDSATAVKIVTERLTAVPADWEALGWHARLIAQAGQWAKAEIEYREALAHSPEDCDLITGLADVLTWQGKYLEALEVLDRAPKARCDFAEIHTRRARVLMAVEKAAEATAEYRAVLRLDPENREVQAAIRISAKPRHELRVGNDTDTFNYTDAASLQSVSLRTRWNARWSTQLGVEFNQRFGESAQKVRLSATVQLPRRTYLSAGGAVANRQDVISRYEQSLELGHVFVFRHLGMFRGLETSMEERTLWYSSSNVALLRGTALLYLPRDWMWGISVTAARSSFDAAGDSWSPSGSTRLWIPLHPRVRGNLMFAVGSENFSNFDQVGRFSARSYGGGVRFLVTEQQDLSVNAAYQRRSQQRTQTSLGISYGIRF